MIVIMKSEKLIIFVQRGNFLPSITKSYIQTCNFDMVSNTYCPIFRVGDVVRYAQQNFSELADKVKTFVVLRVLNLL